MNIRVVVLLAALACPNVFAEDDPLDKLIVNSTRLKCSSGFTEVSYGYKPGATKASSKRLEFVVIQTNESGSQFRSLFHLGSKVDDVTPPAYIRLEEHTVDLQNTVQLHAVGGGRYSQSQGDVTLDEVRAWLDQPDLDATIESLLAFTSKTRQSGVGLAQEHVTQVAPWIPARPQKVVFESEGTAQILNDNSVQLDGDTQWQEFTLYFEFQRPTQIQEIRIEVLPRTVSVDADHPGHRKKTGSF